MYTSASWDWEIIPKISSKSKKVIVTDTSPNNTKTVASLNNHDHRAKESITSYKFWALGGIVSGAIIMVLFLNHKK